MESKLEYQDLRFSDQGTQIKVYFYDIFYFLIEKAEAGHDIFVDGRTITFKGLDEDRAKAVMAKNIDQGMRELKNSINGRKAVFLHKEMGIPLVGSNNLGIVVRNSSIIEIKPITGCNLNCIYCSVSEGECDRLLVDYVIEPEFLANELSKVLLGLDGKEFEVHIGTQGEPLLYARLADLVRLVSSQERVKLVSIDTNGLLLNEDKADELISAGLGQFNVSINALDREVADRIAGGAYNVERVVAIIRYLASKASVVIAPVYVPSINDTEIPKLIGLAKELGCRMGIQNYLPYKSGRRPVKGIIMDKFYSKLREWEKVEAYQLVLEAADFGIKKIKPLAKPFRKRNVAEITLAFPGRRAGEMVGFASGRLVTVVDCLKKAGRVRVRITGDKHNVFYGVIV